MINKIISVNFSLDRNEEKNISTHDYTDLMKSAKSYTIGSGKNIQTYDIVHTTAGYISLHK